MSSPSSRSRKITLAVLAAAALAMALAYSSCSKKEEAEAPSAGSPPAAQAQAPAPAPAPATGEASGGTAAPGGAATGAPAAEGTRAGGGAAAEPPGTRVAMADKTDKASAAQPPGVAVLVRGDLSITGEVTLAGNPPEMQPLKRGVDPVCAKTPMNDEQVLAKNGKLENVVVWVSDGVPPQPAPAEQAKLQQTQCMYRPRVQAVQDGQTIAIKNGDATLHNVRAVRGTKTLFNKAQPPGSPEIAEAVSAGPALQFKCDVHPWMKAYAVVVSNPFHAVTGPDGKFTISGLPPGKYTVSAWHELFGTKTSQIDLQGKSVPILFTYNAQDRE